ncbi:MAG: exodeoxyribonuclease VII large subunit [Deltaproteobacteria bacterium]|nr:exodeoxyribonuclease VII large subunit [Deltaproteobacteria bacterium]
MDGDLFGDMPAVEGTDGVLSVSQLTARIKQSLEERFRFVRVEGEVSNYKLYPSGHRYFSLKDEGAQIRVVLFKGRERFVFGELRDGQTAVVTGSLGVYEKKGEYQIYAQSAVVRGLGSLLVELEKRKARLAAEGLFDESRKRPLPPFPSRVGVVTSRQGAAIRDMVRVLRQRWPGIGITLAPALVQGENAATDIVEALGVLAAEGHADVIIVGRGGGSIEDLWAFNEEAVVRAIASCPVPVISAVGHESDVTLADFAADRRAPTPTGAAQMAVPDRLEVLDRVSSLALRARRAERNAREMRRRELRIAAAALADPRAYVQSRRYAAAESANALAEFARRRVREARDRVVGFSTSVRLHSPSAWVMRRRGDLALLTERAVRRVASLRDALRGAVGLLDGKLAALDPKGVLSRGYAIVTRREGGRAVRSVTEVRPGDPLGVHVTDGRFGAVVAEGDG